MDTKWKALDYTKGNFGISQADAYQMHGYARVYNADETILLYPKLNDGIYKPTDWTFENSNTHLRVATVNTLDEIALKRDLIELLTAVPKRLDVYG